MADKKSADNGTKVKPPSGTFGELKLMVTDYAKQQTVEPLKNLGKWAGFGVGGAICLMIGAFLTGLGLLRLLQEQTGWADDGFSTASPYLIVFLVLAISAVLCLRAATKTPEWMESDK